jgi:hypothetical protein
MNKEERSQLKLSRQRKRRENFDKWSRRIPRYGVRLGLFICVGCISYFTYDLVKQYQSSDQWVKVTGPEQATIPTEMFYLTRSEKQKFADYLKAKSTLWDETTKDFKATSTKAHLKAFEDTYQSMDAQVQQSFKDEHQMITQFYQLREQYYHTVSNRQVDVSLKDVNEFLTNANNILAPYLLDTNTQTFVQSMYKNCVNLSKDYNKVIQIQGLLNAMLGVKDNHYILKTSAKRSQLDQITTLADQLTYKWSFVTAVRNKLLSPIQKELTSMESLESAFKAYQEDEKNKKAFEEFASQYKNMDKAIKENTVEYKSFVGKDVEELKSWARDNDLNVDVQSMESTQVNNTVISQRPDTTQYTRIAKKSTITVIISKKSSNSAIVRPLPDDSESEDLPVYEGRSR